MNLRLVYIFAIFLTFLINQTSKAQENNTKFIGLVVQDSIPLENINIVNLNSRLGTFSNEFGQFHMTGKLGDSIQFTSLMHTKRTIRLSQTHISNKSINVYLDPSTNELDEVMLATKYKFNFENIYLHKNMQLDKDFMDNIKPPDLRSKTDPTHTLYNFDIIGSFVLLARVIFKEKIERKNEYYRNENKKKQFISNFVAKHGEDFFINNFSIPEHKVYLFVDYCTDNGLKEYFESDEFTIFNFLVKQSENFNAIKP